MLFKNLCVLEWRLYFCVIILLLLPITNLVFDAKLIVDQLFVCTFLFVYYYFS